MRIKALKQSLWILNAILALGMAFVLYSVLGGSANAGPATGSEALELKDRGGGTPDLRAASDHRPFPTYHFAHDLPISGFPPAPPEAPAGPAETENVPPLKQNYKLVWVKSDPDPLKSYAHLQRKGAEDRALNVTVGGKIEGWKLVEVRVDAGRGFADFERSDTGERVTLDQEVASGPSLTDPKAAGPGTAASAAGITPGGSWVVPEFEKGPEREPVQIRDGQWEVPVETSRWVSVHYEKIAEEAAIESVTDPETKKPLGLLVKKLPKTSIVQRSGIMEGDILKSINGVPLSTKQEAMAWLKGEGKGQSRYIAIVLRKGREISITYNVRD